MLRLFWMIAGGLSLAVGVAGIVLPLVPTTPLLLLAAYCFARSSPRLEAWLLDHPRLGPPIHHWRAEGAISSRAKTLAMVAIGAAFALSVFLQLPVKLLVIQGVTLGAVIVFILTRPTPRLSTHHTSDAKP
ncbi:YbaN family protein [Pararhodobacter zhoushanensis]|uniref:YbaN family protein n=1 Tax=Pararhodobacter zhoushanensis TaxID=2479545 RepID=UPI0022231B2B|nr:YbaN family protein [Pararhodobacter zhoushanensis]MCW1404389.1 YbaN family protein [Novosphingobium sp. MW5]